MQRVLISEERKLWRTGFLFIVFHLQSALLLQYNDQSSFPFGRQILADLARCKVFNHPSHPVRPPLVTVNRIAVNPDCKGWRNLQSLSSLLQSVTKLFTVGDETYIGTHRTVPVSFVTDCRSYATDCKSNDSAYKFCQPLQSVTIGRTTIRLTITRGRRLKSNPVRPGGGGWLKTAISDFIRPGRGVLGGVRLKSFHRLICYVLLLPAFRRMWKGNVFTGVSKSRGRESGTPESSPFWGGEGGSSHWSCLKSCPRSCLGGGLPQALVPSPPRGYPTSGPRCFPRKKKAQGDWERRGGRWGGEKEGVPRPG